VKRRIIKNNQNQKDKLKQLFHVILFSRSFNIFKSIILTKISVFLFSIDVNTSWQKTCYRRISLSAREATYSKSFVPLDKEDWTVQFDFEIRPCQIGDLLSANSSLTKIGTYSQKHINRKQKHKYFRTKTMHYH